MKKIFLLIAVLFTFTQVSLNAQTDFDEVIFNLELVAVFDIEVVEGALQEITFDNSDQWNNGTYQGNGIVDGYSIVTVDATSNWDMFIKAPDFIAVTGTGTVPIDNLGVWCEALGTNNFSGASSCGAQAAVDSQGITTADAILIANDGGNMGNNVVNRFQLNWRMGTQEGSMNTASMLELLTLGGFTLGTYTTTATLTINPAL